jgi:hypothetical protein
MAARAVQAAAAVIMAVRGRQEHQDRVLRAAVVTQMVLLAVVAVLVL